jgi:Tfp pilus assembly protein PilZ
MTNARRDFRYEAHFPAQITFAKKRLSLFTEDLGYGGVFVRTDTPPALRQLVRVRLVVPFVARALDMHGMTVHVVGYDNRAARVPGIGVQFYGLDRDTREAWEATVRHVATTAPLAPDQSPFILPSDTPEPIRRRFQRHTAVLTVKTGSQNELDTVVTRDVSAGGTFIRTKESFKLGAPVMVCIHHPDNGSTFILDGIVRHAHGEGVGVEFVGIDALRRDEFIDFVRGGILIDEERFELGEST